MSRFFGYNGVEHGEQSATLKMGFAHKVVSGEHQTKQTRAPVKGLYYATLHDMQNHTQMFESLLSRSEACSSSITVNGTAETGSAQLQLSWCSTELGRWGSSHRSKLSYAT